MIETAVPAPATDRRTPQQRIAEHGAVRLEEVRDGPARDLRDDSLEETHDFVAPELLPFEVINALRSSGHDEGDRLVRAAASLAAYGIDRRSLAGSGAVAPVALDLDVTVYDASSVALATEVDGLAYTADELLPASASGTAHEDRLAHVADYR